MPPPPSLLYHIICRAICVANVHTETDSYDDQVCECSLAALHLLAKHSVTPHGNVYARTRACTQTTCNIWHCMECGNAGHVMTSYSITSSLRLRAHLAANALIDAIHFPSRPVDTPSGCPAMCTAAPSLVDFAVATASAGSASIKSRHERPSIVSFKKFFDIIRCTALPRESTDPALAAASQMTSGCSPRNLATALLYPSLLWAVCLLLATTCEEFKTSVVRKRGCSQSLVCVTRTHSCPRQRPGIQGRRTTPRT